MVIFGDCSPVSLEIVVLTDSECREATCPKDKARARLTDGSGLYLEVSPAGSKRWFWKTYADGKEGRLALGSYPKLTLKAARKARDVAKLQKSEGADPIKLRKVEKLKATRTGDDTFKAVALDWYGKQSPQWSDSHAERSLRQLERDLFPWIGDKPMSEIHAMELLAALQKVEERGAIETADRVFNAGAAGLGLLVTHCTRPATQHHGGAKRTVDALQGQDVCRHP